ncbi:hypothetical protein ACM66B_006987 [Microbotryomycetes sp. NB124-2]
MERRRSRTPPSPGTDSLEQLVEQQRVLARQQRELQDRIDRRQRAIKLHDQNTNVIVAASPSPRKRARASYDLQSPPAKPAFHDSTLAGPPAVDSNGNSTSTYIGKPSKGHVSGDYDDDDGRLEHLLAKEHKPAAISKFVTGLTGISLARSDSQKKKQQRQQRSTEFAATTTTTTSKAVGKSNSGNSKHVSSSKVETSDGERPERSGPLSEPARPSAVKGERSGRNQNDDGDDGDDDLDIVDAPVHEPKRRKDGTLIESLEVGPHEHKPPKDDPEFKTIEPNSGIRLIPGSRVLPHKDLQAHLDGRYHLTPSLIYSLSRKELGTENVDIDIDGDFVLIGVLAWKSPIKVMNPGTKQESKQRKCVRFTLVDLRSPETSRSGSSVLSVLLMEAESVDEGVEQDGWKAPQYRGGSGGAYEKFWKEAPGAVVAILNPQMLKHRQEPGQPFNPYTLTLSSANSMMVIGRARDLATCSAIKANGDRCDNWIDARDRKVCEFHLHRSVKSGAARRPETNANTNSLSASTSMNTSKFNKHLQRKPSANASKNDVSLQPAPKKTTFDAQRKIGLLPDNKKPRVVEGLETWTTSTGTALTGSSARSNVRDVARGDSNFVAYADRGFVRGFNDGVPEEELKRQRRKIEKEKERGEIKLRDVLSRDGGDSAGAQYLKKLRGNISTTTTTTGLDEASGADDSDDKRKRKRDGTLKDDALGDSDASASGTDSALAKETKKHQDRKRPFGTAAVRLIGFDPTNQKADEDEETKRQRLDIVSSLLADRKPPSLAAPPGPKVRSGVVAPVDEADERRRKQQRDSENQRYERDKARAASGTGDDDDDDDDDDLVVEGGPRAEEVRLDERLCSRVSHVV